MAAINPYTPTQQIQVPERPVAISSRTDRAAPVRDASAAPPRSDLTARLDNLISSEVSDGRLTANQANELRSLFKDVFAEIAVGPLQPKIEGTADVMQDFLDALQASLESSAAAIYGPSGQNNVAAIKTVPPLLVDYRT